MAQILVGLVGATDPLLEQCRDFLTNSAVVRAIAEDSSHESLGLDVILVVASDPMTGSLPLVAELRANNQRVPIVIVASGITSEIALDFVHRGADDFVPLPLNKAALRLKVERSLRARAGRSLHFASTAPASVGPTKVSPGATDRAPPPNDMGLDDEPTVAQESTVADDPTVSAATPAPAPKPAPAKVCPMAIPKDIPMSLLPADYAPPAPKEKAPAATRPAPPPAMPAAENRIIPSLPPLEQEMQQYAGFNQRRCFRSKPPPKLPATAAFKSKDGIVIQMPVENLSIPTDGWPGGLLVAFPVADKPLFMEAGWHKMREFTLALHIPGGPPIPTVARIVPGPLREVGGMLRFALQYLPERPTDMPRLQQYWMECQRHWLY